MSPVLHDENSEIYERVARLEAVVEGMAPKVSEMHEIMLQGRGVSRIGRAALWLAMSAGLGGFAANKWPAILKTLGS